MKNIYSPTEIDNDIILLDDEKHELFYSKINALPQNIQNILFYLDTEEKLKNISTQAKLNQNQSAELTRLVRDILISDVYLGDIVKETQKHLVVSEETAREIANQIISEIFAPALEELKKNHVQKFGKKTENAPTPANPPASNPGNINNPNNMVDLRNK